MRQHGQSLKANAIIGMRYDATELMAGLTEVLAMAPPSLSTPIE
ncbi:heavy metal-binding domain-containing protein [Propionivibrio sp.]